MAKKIALVLLLLIAGALVYAATRPTTFSVERSTTINAPPQKIFAIIEDFKQWSAWSPWDKMDPDMKRTYSGSERGLGAIYAWEGNSDVGKGRMEIIEAVPNELVVERLKFLEPFESESTVTFTLTAKGQQTEVKWAMSGENEFMAKLVGIFLDMDALVGKDFEAGLAKLKALAEQG